MAKQKAKKKDHQIAPPHTTPHDHLATHIGWHWPSTILVILLPLVLYWQTIDYGYVLDDTIVIVDNQYTQKGFGGMWDILTTESFQGYFGEKKNLVQGNRYRPLSIMTFAAEVGLWGSKPGISHAINILLYILTGLLLYRLLLRLVPRDHTSWWVSLPLAVTLLYLAHPLHSEAVANIKGRDEIMAMLLSLGTLYYTVRYVALPSIALLLAVITTYFLGLLAKENTITFLAVIPLTLWFFDKASWSQIGKVSAVLAATTLAYLGLRFSTAGVPDFGQEIPDLMNNPFLGMSGAEKSATIFYTFAKYLKLLALPYPLSHDYYPYAIPRVNWTSMIALGSLVVHVLAGLWAVFAIRKKNIYAYSILFYLITFSIVSNVVINVGTFMNERFVYMASLGFCMAMGYLLIKTLRAAHGAIPHWLGPALAGGIVLVYSVITLARVPAWQSALALNASAVTVSPNSARANSFMATAIYNEYIELPDKADHKDLLDRGQYYADRALSIIPNYGNANTMRLGFASERYKLDNDVSALLETFGTVIKVRPDMDFMTQFLEYLNGRGIHSKELLTWYAATGNMLVNDYRNYRWATHYMELGLNIDYRNARLNQSLANAYELAGQPAKAQEALNRIQ